jgi:hypothetical protein
MWPRQKVGQATMADGWRRPAAATDVLHAAAPMYSNNADELPFSLSN